MRRHAVLLLLLSACTGAEDGGFGKQNNQGNTDGGAPVINILLPEAGQVYGLYEVVEINGFVHEWGGVNDLQMGVRSDLGGALDASFEFDPDGNFASTIELQSGTHTLEVWAVNELGKEGTAEVTVVKLANQAPSAPELAFTPSAPVTDELLSVDFVVDSVDPEGQPLVYHSSWWRNGEEQESLRDELSVQAGVIQRGEVWRVQVYATDGDLDSEPGEAEVQVQAAGPQIQVTIAPSPPQIDDLVSCSWTIDEPDGEPITDVQAEWTLDGVSQGDASSPLFGVFTRGQELECTVGATSTSRAEVTVATTVANATPVLDHVTLSGAPTNELGTLTCSASATDIDGDPVTLQPSWFVNGATVQSGVWTLDGADFNRDDEVWCSVTASDPDTSTAPMESAHTVIENSPPSTPTVQLSPNPAAAGSLLTCAVGTPSVDVDPGDVLVETWSWSVNGNLVTGATDTLDTGPYAAGSRVQCTLRVDDGTAGVASSDQLVLGARLQGALAASDVQARVMGTESRAAFGDSLGVLPDIDGDGAQELLVTAPTGAGSRGAVYLFTASGLLGADHTDADAAYAFEGTDPGDKLGGQRGFTAVPDVDGDGRTELLLAAYDADYGGMNDVGGAYLLLSGGQGAWSWGGSVDGAADWIVYGENDRDRLGSALLADDLNGDGVTDLAMSVPLHDGIALNAGEVAFFLGSANPPSGVVRTSDATWRVTGAAERDRLGLNAVRSVGDLDGDGDVELFLGAPTATGGAPTAGAGFVVSSSDLASGGVAALAMARLEGTATGDNFGISAAGVGDIDGDGLAELAVGASAADVSANDGGGVYLWFGGVAGTLAANSADASWGGSASGDRLGWEISAADMDNDGLMELFTGASSVRTNNQANAGEAYLLLGADFGGWTTGMDVSARSQVSLSGAVTGERVGRSSEGAADLDGDGFNDWVVGAQGVTSQGVFRTGEVWLLSGP